MFLALDVKRLLLGTGIVLAVFATFGMSVLLGFAPVDDTHLIIQNLALRQMTLGGFSHIFTMFDPELYIPLTFLSFKVELLIAGTQAWLFHFDNLLLHIGNVFLVVWIIKRISGSSLAAWCAAFLFAVHPLNVESVVWLSSRKDLLATFFALLSVIFALRSIDRESRMLWIVSIIFFLCALLSKISVVLLPMALIPILAKEKFTLRSASIMLAPYLIASLVLGIVALLGKADVLASTPLLHRLIFSGFGIVKTIKHFFLPIHLSLYYTIPAMHPQIMVIACIPLLLVIFGCLAWKRSPLIAIGIAWFLLFILPTVMNIQADIHSPGLSFASDRYAYLPMIGLLIAIVGCLQMIQNRFSESAARRLSIAATAILVIIFFPLAHAQINTWSNAFLLFSHAVEVSPQSVQARIALAETYKKNGDIRQAFDVLKQGLAYGNDERLHLEAGLLYASANQIADARNEFTTVQQMDPKSPEAFNALASLAAYEGNNIEAKNLYEQAIAIAIASDNNDARIGLAKILIKDGNNADAEKELRTVLQTDAGNVDALGVLIPLLRQEKKDAEASMFAEQAALLTN